MWRPHYNRAAHRHRRNIVRVYIILGREHVALVRVLPRGRGRRCNRVILKQKPVFLTWLPLSHSYEHTVQFIQILVGAKIFYAESCSY